MCNTKNFLLCLFLMVTVVLSCTAPAKEETKTDVTPPISRQTADSIITATGVIPARTNVRGSLNDKKWVSTSFGINVFKVGDKKTYAIFLTDGKQRVSVNYSGPEKKGTVNTGELLQAAILGDSKDPYICDEGFVEFTQFDTLTKIMSGKLMFRCAQKDKKANTINFNDVAFDNLTWK